MRTLSENELVNLPDDSPISVKWPNGTLSEGILQTDPSGDRWICTPEGYAIGKLEESKAVLG